MLVSDFRGRHEYPLPRLHVLLIFSSHFDAGKVQVSLWHTICELVGSGMSLRHELVMGEETLSVMVPTVVCMT